MINLEEFKIELLVNGAALLSLGGTWLPRLESTSGATTTLS